MLVAILDNNPGALTYIVQTLKLKMPVYAASDSRGRAPISIESHGFATYESLQAALRTQVFDLLVLSWDASDQTAVTFLHWLRASDCADTPVLALSANEEDAAIADAFAQGVDDYCIQPIRPLEFCARVACLLFPKSKPLARVEQFGAWTLIPQESCVRFTPGEGKEVLTLPLSESEFRLAHILFKHMGHVVARAYLLASAGFHQDESVSRTLDSHIYRLRTLLFKPAFNLRLRTVYARGYALENMRSAPATPFKRISAGPQ